MKRFLTLVVALAAVAWFASPAAQAAKPTIERITIDNADTDEFLTEACGVTVTFTERGHITVRTFGEVDKGLAQVRSVNIAVVLSANGNSYRLRDVGADVLRVTPDGVAILSLMGQLPFFFTGVLKIDLSTGEVVHEPRHLTDGDIATACAVLAG